MATRHDTAFDTAATPSLIYEFGETVAYSMFGQAASNFTAIVGAIQDMPQMRDDGEYWVQTCTVSFQPSNAPTVSTRDTVTIRGMSFAVQSIDSVTPMVTVTCVRNEMHAAGRGHAHG